MDDLIECILDQIPTETLIHGTIIDPAMGGGQFLRAIEQRKRAAGLSPAEISDTVYGLEHNVLRKNYAVRKHNLCGTYGCHDIKGLNGMRFDVVIGNPPYGDSDDSGGALWETFVNQAFNELVKPDGYVAMVHPPSFLGKHLQRGNGKTDYTAFNTNQIAQLHVFDDHERKKHFPKAGTKVCWYVARSVPQHTTTTLVGYDNGQTYSSSIDMTAVRILPNVINAITMSIHNKLMSAPLLEFKQKRELHYHTLKKKNQVSDSPTKTHIYKSYFSHKIVRYTDWQYTDYADIKVMVPQTSTVDKSFIDSNCNVSEDLFYVTCRDINEAHDIHNHMSSDLVKYIGKLYRQGRNLGSTLARIIPDPAANIVFTAQEQAFISANAN